MTLSLSTPTPVTTSYQEMLARLKNEELQTLSTKMDQLVNRDSGIDQLCSALSNCTLNDKIFTSCDLPYYALEAFRLEQIDEYQFGSLQLLWSIGQCHNGFDTMRVIPLFTQDGQRNPDAIKMIQQTLDGSIPIGISNHERLRFLTHEEFAQFVDEMKNLPASEQRFFVVPEMQYPSLTISQRIKTNTGINIFNALAGGYRMIPSLGMMQTILNVKYGKNAVKINPVLGLSTLSQLERDDARDMAIPYPGIFLPDTADHYRAPWYDFSYHDFYHAILCSSFPKVYRHLMFAVANVALQEINDRQFQCGTTEKRTYQAFRFAALDMETPAFRSERPLRSMFAPEVLFWLEIHALAIKVFDSHSLTQFDAKTVENFYQKIAYMLLVDGKGIAVGLTRRSLKKAHSALRAQVVHPVMRLRLFKVMSRYVKAHEQNRDAKSLIPLGVQVQITAAKMIARKNFDFQNAIDPLQTLPAGISESDHHAIALLVPAGVSQDEYLALAPCDRDYISQLIQTLLPLILSGVSLQQIIPLQQNRFLADATDVLLALLEQGASWQQISEFLQRNSLSYESRQVILSLLNAGANLDELQSGIDNSNIWTILVEHRTDLQRFVDKGVCSGNTFMQLQPPFLKQVLIRSYAVTSLLKAGCTFEELANCPFKFFEQILTASYEVCQLMRAGVSLSQLVSLSPSLLDKALTPYLHHPIKAGMSFDELMKPEHEERFQLVVARFMHVKELLTAGVSSETFFELEMPKLRALCEKLGTGQLLQLQFPLDWLIKISLEPTISTHFFYVAYLVKNGKASVTQLISLSIEKLALLLNKLKDADCSHHTLDSVDVEPYLQK